MRVLFVFLMLDPVEVVVWSGRISSVIAESAVIMEVRNAVKSPFSLDICFGVFDGIQERMLKFHIC